MKKLLILALSAASLFCVYGESLEDAVDKVERMIEKTYRPGSMAQSLALKKLAKIVESQKNDEAKVAELRKEFSKAFPATKETLIVREPVIWKIHSLSLGYDIKEGAAVENKTVDIVKNLKQSDASVQKSRNSQTNETTSTATSTKGSVTMGGGSWLPWKWLPQTSGSVSGHFETGSTDRQESGTVWNEKNQQMFQRNLDEIHSMIRQSNIQNLHLSFTVTLINQTDSTLTIDLKTASIPVYMGDRSCNQWSHPFNQADVLILRPRSSGQDVVFRMELDTTGARELVDYMAKSSPTIALEKGTFKIQDPKGQDMVIEKNALPVSAPVVLLSPAGSYYCKIRKNHEYDGAVTIEEACDAVSKDVKQFKDPLFVKDGKGGYASVSGVPFGPDENLENAALMEYRGTFYQEVSADLLKMPIGIEGFSIHIVKLDEPDKIQNLRLLEAVTKLYRKAAEQGNAKAQFLLGRCYYNGDGVKQDKTQAVLWYRKAAEQGFAKAQHNLGVCCCNGEGVEKDLAQGVQWFRKSAEQGLAASQCVLGFCYRNGEGVEKDLTQAAQWYRKAAEQGHEGAQGMLGLFYQLGWGVKKDPKQAVYWYRKAAEQGVKIAQCSLGDFYDEGFGVKKDPVQAVYWYRKAAEQGFATAQNGLGFCYGIGRGVKKDSDQAVHWFRKAAEQGHAGAQYNLGICYRDGEGVKKDPVQSAQWFLKAAEQGHAGAQNSIGVCFYEGAGVEKDLVQAVQWFQQAAEQGHAGAQKNLAVCYRDGKGIEKDPVQAAQWFRKAAEQGNASAQFELGACYYFGEGVEKDPDQAVQWYRKAANQGHAEAQRALSSVNGKGVKMDLGQWFQRYRKAAAQSLTEAHDALSRFGK